jgi:hypothetical protein
MDPFLPEKGGDCTKILGPECANVFSLNVAPA